MSRDILPRNNSEPRLILQRDGSIDTTVVGLDYYGVILPPEVEGYMLRVWAEVNALENDLRTHFGKKYGVESLGTDTEPPKYKTPAEKWQASDLQFAQNFDVWVLGYRRFARNYIEGSCGEQLEPMKTSCKAAHLAWQWVGSNSLTAYKETEAYEKQIADWQKIAKDNGVTVIGPTPASAVTKLDLSDISSVVKWGVVGALGYFAWSYATRPSAKSVSEKPAYNHEATVAASTAKAEAAIKAT